MRIRIPLLAYVTAATTASACFVMTLQLLDSAAAPPPTGWGVLFVALAIIIALAALPAGLPTIIITARRKSGPWWLFFAAGLAAGLGIIAVIFYYTGSPKNAAIIPITTLSGAMTYWLIAWRIFPPSDNISSTLEVFE